ncbi:MULTISPECIES: hypothetical protein [unclassified Gilliamella]|uniref:hypothetical protein n=1 Tax=unclassified Gilliamella TaxID=2685620 RepID=UPI000A32E3DC|nr:MULTISPECIES: hypothetical protein [unclassified Gilliamella]MBI0102977.1 hypothetical protein [Gilliamella sp. W8145]OTQ57548.1 hypothetical protein B6D18_09720 [Gilliamella sp. A7]
MKLQTPKIIYARRLVIFRIIVLIVAAIFLYHIAPDLWFNFVIFLFAIIVLIVRYFMVYVTIGENFITCRPIMIQSQINVPFDLIKSIKYEPKKIFINYTDEMDGKESILKISLEVLEANSKTELLDILKIVLKDKTL